MDPQGRVFTDPGELKKAIEKDSGPDARIVLTNGIFDMIHVGHLRYLAGAADHGDVLVVAVNDDLSTRRLKGPGRPVMPVEERAESLLSLRQVDYVLVFTEETVDSVLRLLCPAVHAKGTDYSVATVPELETAREIGCRTVITGDPKDHSSSEIIGRIQEEEDGSCR